MSAPSVSTEAADHDAAVAERDKTSPMRPIDLVLSRLDGHRVRPNGRDRWRACCPAHGGSNPSALSIGVGDDDVVLLKCWHGCDVDAVAAALGLDVCALFPPKVENHHGVAPLMRRRLLTPGQALDLLDMEMTLAIVCANDMARGKSLDEATRGRLLLSAARVSMLRQEMRK